jgi:hypothetical protein
MGVVMGNFIYLIEVVFHLRSWLLLCSLFGQKKTALPRPMQQLVSCCYGHGNLFVYAPTNNSDPLPAMLTFFVLLI